MRLLFLKPLDDAHLYSVSVEALSAAVRALGVEAEVFDPQGDAHRYVERLAHGRFDAVVSFGGFLGALTRTDGVSIYDVLGVEFVQWGFDHPIYLSHQMLPRSTRRRCIWPHPSHAAFVEGMGADGVHAVGLAGATPPLATVKSWSERRTPLLFAARWNGVPMRSWAGLEDSPAKRLLDGLTGRLIEDREASLIAACRDACADLGIQPSFSEDWLRLMRAALTYVRDHDRLAAVMVIADAGLPLTVCGDGWEAALGDRPNVALRPTVPFAAMAELYGDARVVLSVNAGNGGCERAVGAAMSGAAVVSDPSCSLEAELGAGLRVYDRARPSSLAEAAAALLDGDGAEAAEVHAAAVRGSSWATRAAGLIAYLSA